MATKPKRVAREESTRDSVDFGPEYRLKVRIVDGAISILRTAVRGGILLGSLYLASVGVAPFAGRNTEVVALVKAMADFKADRYFFAVTAVLASGAWWQERRKRTKLITDWGSYVKELEERIDPDRTSSGLLIDGKPTKEDADVL